MFEWCNMQWWHAESHKDHLHLQNWIWRLVDYIEFFIESVSSLYCFCSELIFRFKPMILVLKPDVSMVFVFWFSSSFWFYLFISLFVFLTGLLCLTSSTDLVETKLGKTISFGLGCFWSIRLIIQFFGYSSKLWKGKTFETVIHVLFTGFWIYLSTVFKPWGQHDRILTYSLVRFSVIGTVFRVGPTNSETLLVLCVPCYAF